MKAIVLRSYGSPEHLRYEDVERPKPAADEVLVEVKATAVNDYDWSMVRGKPFIYRLMFGLSKPKNPTPGMELSGVVVDLGHLVTKFKIGDRVYGDTSDHCFGTFAEFCAVHANALQIIPKNLSFADAAATPHAALLAVQALKLIAKIDHGQKILINGAGGGVGTFGLQYAKLFDTHVTGVDSQDKHLAMQRLGFDEVIDYKKHDFTKNGVEYDIVLDAKTNRSVWHYLRSLKSGGIYVSVGGNLPKLFQIFLLGFLLARLFKKHLRILPLKPNHGLEDLKELLASGKLRCEIDGPYPLSQAPQALQHFGEAKHLGKVIIAPSRG